MTNTGTKTRKEKGLLARIVAMHPYKTFLLVAILGIAILFLFLLVAFQLTKNPQPIFNFKFPKSFVFSTVVLIASSFALNNILDNYKKDEVYIIINKLIITFVLGIFFTVSQFVGWRELSQNGTSFQGQVSGSYLYLISGLHMVHLLGGMIFLYVELILVWQKSKDAVKCLIYFTDPYERLKLELLRIYWHFMDVLWIVLFFYFLFSF